MTDAHTIKTETGTVSFPAGTLVSIVTRAAESIDGASVRRRGVDLKVENGHANVRVALTVRYGVVVPEAGAEVQRAVAHALVSMCDLQARAVDLHVEDLE